MASFDNAKTDVSNVKSVLTLMKMLYLTLFEHSAIVYTPYDFAYTIPRYF